MGLLLKNLWVTHNNFDNNFHAYIIIKKQNISHNRSLVHVHSNTDTVGLYEN